MIIIDLEFFYTVDGVEQSVCVGLRRFIEVHLEATLGQHSPLPPNLVLVVCNPGLTQLKAPFRVPTPGMRVHYALGDQVLSWLDEDPATETMTQLRLSADAWRVLGR